MIKLFSTHCPKCNVLEMKFKENGIQYELITEDGDLLKTAKALGIMSAPFVIDDKKKYYTFPEALEALSRGEFNA